MENIILDNLILMDIDEIREGLFWCKFGRKDESKATNNDVTKLERIIKSNINITSIEFIDCDSGTLWISEGKPEWFKSVVLVLQANSKSEVKNFLADLSQST